MAKNTGIPYERLTKWIVEQISIESGVHTTKIEHDVDLQGRDAIHQIDVLWEFDICGIKYTTIIQAKDWSTQNVDQGKLLQFKCVLNDLPGQPRGIVVARKGFQSGAIEFAQKNGIVIYELREPTEVDWSKSAEEGRITIFNINMDVYTPHFADIRLNQDETWNIQNLKRLNRQLSEAPRIEISDELKFYDKNDLEIASALILFNSLVPEGFNELPPTRVTYPFEKPTFIKTSNPQVRAKINSIEMTITKTLETKTYQLRGEKDFAGYILRNVISGDIKTFLKRRP